VVTEELPPSKPLVPSKGETGFWGPELVPRLASVPSGEFKPLHPSASKPGEGAE
jgi:hypothetical protein